MKDNSPINGDYFENIIACQALTNSYYTSLVHNYLLPENFKSKGNRLVVGIVKDFYLKRQSLPTVTEIRTYLKSPDEFQLLKDTLTAYKQIDLNGNIDELISNSETFFKEKTVFHTVQKIVNDCAADKADYRKFLDMFEKAVNLSLVSDVGLNYFREYKKVLTELGSQTETISTGWKYLDDKIGGGFQKKGRALYLFLGPTNVGKSIFLGNIAANLSNRGITTVLITLEMPEMMYAKRISSHLSKIPVNHIQTQIGSLETYFESVVNTHADKLFIKEFPPKSVTVNGLKSYIEVLIKSGVQIGAIVVDYLGLVKAGSGENSYEQGKSVAEELRALSYFFSVPVVSAIQTNREGMSNPSLDTVSESLGVAFTADVVWSIFQDDGDADLGIMKVGGIKNRLGPKHGATAMRIDYTTLSLSEEEGYVGISSGRTGSTDTMSSLEVALEKMTDRTK